MQFLLEVIAFDIESCKLAYTGGAHRIELCDNPADGGTTPSYGLIKQARKTSDIQLYPILRPRGGDFLYTEDEFNVMKDDIIQCKNLGCDGVVIGLLNKNGTVDNDRTSLLVELAYPMGVTFHRAFDRTKDPFQSMEDIINCGCERILTSGQKPTATEGIELIKELVVKSDNRIIIMPGSGLRSENIKDIALKSGATEFHSSARKFVNSTSEYNNPNLSETLKQVQLHENEVKSMISILTDL